MNFLRNYLDKQKPKFEKGGKLYKLHSVFTGFESFLFVPNRTTSSGCNIRDAIDLKRTMIIVVMALIPALYSVFIMWGTSISMLWVLWPIPASSSYSSMDYGECYP